MPADTDPVEQLIAAWVAWDQTPTWETLAERREAAVAAAGLSPTEGLQLHRLVAQRRRSAQLNAGATSRGWSIPDAIQHALLIIRPDLLEDTNTCT